MSGLDKRSVNVDERWVGTVRRYDASLRKRTAAKLVRDATTDPFSHQGQVARFDYYYHDGVVSTLEELFSAFDINPDLYRYELDDDDES